MAASTTKKVEIQRFERTTLHGFLTPRDFLLPGAIQYLTLNGNLEKVPVEEVKAIYFVRDFGSVNGGEDLVFNTRPKTAGLWIRLNFRDGDVLEGILPNDLLSLEPAGYTVSPPGSSGHSRVWIPRAALSRAQVLGVIGTPKRKKAPRPEPDRQPRLFE